MGDRCTVGLAMRPMTDLCRICWWQRNIFFDWLRMESWISKKTNQIKSEIDDSFISHSL
jgi:hypothetical protein